MESHLGEAIPAMDWSTSKWIQLSLPHFISTSMTSIYAPTQLRCISKNELSDFYFHFLNPRWETCCSFVSFHCGIRALYISGNNLGFFHLAQEHLWLDTLTQVINIFGEILNLLNSQHLYPPGTIITIIINIEYLNYLSWGRASAATSSLEESH